MLDSETGRALAQHILARRWLARDRLKLRLPLRFLTLKPGDRLRLRISPAVWSVERVLIDGFAVVAELIPSGNALSIPAAQAEVVASRSAVRTAAAEPSIALLDIPDPWKPPSSELTLFLAGSCQSLPVEIVGAGQRFWTRTAARKTVLGCADTILGPGDPELIDLKARVEVQLVDREQWLTSCSDDDLVDGANLALIGGEIVQFGTADPLGEGRFELSRLVRGRAGTEWASALHEAGETFALLEREKLVPVTLPAWIKGARISAQPRCPDGRLGARTEIAAAGESLRPLSPAHLHARAMDDGALRVSWTRRSQLSWGWLDEVDTPRDQASGLYRVTLAGSADQIVREVAESLATFAETELRSVGPGAARIEVREVGDHAASHPAALLIDLP